MTEKKWVYLFNEVEQAEKYAGSWDGVRTLLGGKGANLAEMTRIDVPVPPGFTITTEACIAYQDDQTFPEGMWDQALAALKTVEKQTGKKFGDPSNPLLVSCRSGAKMSMPGMMDTVLNLGLNDETAEGMVELTENERFVYDSYRRLIQMFGSVVLGIDDEAFEEVLDEFKTEKGAEFSYKFGTMIEIPRAALTAGEVAEVAEFFSFGTNDLTQMTFGYSRDDAERNFLINYVDEGILPQNPFQVLDRKGVGRLMDIAVSEGRKVRPDLEVGICGEHGGDPSSIEFCHLVGNNYVSCSPYRVPVARLAAAQAKVNND